MGAQQNWRIELEKDIFEGENIWRKFGEREKVVVLPKQQTGDLHSKRAAALKSGVRCAFDISIEAKAAFYPTEGK